MTPEEKAQGRARERAGFVVHLRGLADLLERESSLPLPYIMDGTGYPSHEGLDRQQQVEAVFAAAELLGATVEYDRVGGILTARRKTGRVRYCVYAKVGSETTPRDTVTVSSPAEVLGTGAVA